MKKKVEEKDQSKITEFPESVSEEWTYDDFRKRTDEKRQELFQRYNAYVGMMPITRIVKRQTIAPDEMRMYKINLGFEEHYNFEEFLSQSPSSPEFVDLRRSHGYERPYMFPFSSSRDNFGNLQSEHCFLSGSTGMGKSNMCALLCTGFPRRPNPTVTVWVSQKAATANFDVPKMMDKLESDGHKAFKITVGEESSEGKLPLSILSIDDVQKWFDMSKQEFQVFKGIYYGYQRTGGGVPQALGSFVEHPKGARFSNILDGALYGDIFARKKSDELKFKPHSTYFIDISKFARTEGKVMVDIVANAWCKYLYDFISDQRKDLIIDPNDPMPHKKQWQGMLIFDEYYDLVRNFRLERTVKTITRAATQGRQDGISVVLASQTVFGGHSEKIPLSQAGHIFQFKSSNLADRDFVKRIMGWEGSQYEMLLEEIFDKVFPPTQDKEYHKGRILLFSKESGEVAAVKLRLL